MRRCWIVGVLALWAPGLGCSSLTKRGDGFPGYRPGVMPAASAPAQSQVLLPPERTVGATASTGPDRDGQGLSRYFPNLKKPTPGPVAVATTGRPSRFGLRKGRTGQVYTTDARVQLGRGGEVPIPLPVALQVPTADRAVTPTSGDVAAPTPPLPPIDPTADEFDPASLPAPAASTSTSDPSPAPAPAADPAPKTTGPLLDVEGPRVAAPEPAQAVAAPSPNPTEATRTVADEPAQPAQAEPALSPPETRERPRLETMAAVQVVAPREAVPSPTVPKTPDDQAESKAAAPIDPTKALTLPDPSMPTSYSATTDGSTVAAKLHRESHVHPSAQVAPTAQSVAKPAAPAKTWKRPCLRRAVRKVWKLGEYATPPTAAPH